MGCRTIHASLGVAQWRADAKRFSWNLQASNPSKSSWTPKPPTSLPSRLCRTIPFWQQSRKQERPLTVVKLMGRRWLFDLVDHIYRPFACSGPPLSLLSAYPLEGPNLGEGGITFFVFAILTLVLPSMSKKLLFRSIISIPVTWNSIDVFQKLHIILRLNEETRPTTYYN